MADAIDTIIDPAHRITRSDASMLSMLTDPSRHGPKWLGKLEEKHKNAIVGKIVSTMNDLDRGDRQDAKILARLATVLARFDALDLKRDELVQRTHQPTEHKHLHLHGAADPRSMTDEDLDAYIAEQRSRIASDSGSGA